MTRARHFAGAVLACLAVACGKKGPPLPPLMRVPVAPAELTAERRGSEVDVRVRTPVANTDGSRPADIARVDVYALPGTRRATDAEWVALGEKVASVPVAAPSDAETDDGQDESGSKTPASSTAGIAAPAVAAPSAPVQQGAVMRVTERLDGQRAARAASGTTPAAGRLALPLPVFEPSTRTYAAVGVTRRGRRGPFSSTASVLTGPAPAPPDALDVSYDESAVTVRWHEIGRAHV